jgi:hypothetical protein
MVSQLEISYTRGLVRPRISGPHVADWLKRIREPPIYDRPITTDAFNMYFAISILR